ncbi:MAG TPA: hypothetical protein PKV16_06975 [Caldisericia bacterium]|nr:hypothetical protein [Caldisericia bacterium]HPF49510.1 hypothetical protein [Caldisericia bacterium]HPI84196.1 hypothetical protein [Caldisericia bacterium]HPQ93509.1 hypothetical protein [Caldisericia bacterium]HRV75485.1 hypothetical protein [Caldisericia bacterium]
MTNNENNTKGIVEDVEKKEEQRTVETETRQEKKSFLSSLSEAAKEQLAEAVVLILAGIAFAIPFLLYLINSGVFGEILLSGRGDYSPFLDRLFLLSAMFFVMYLVSWIKPEIKYRASKVFGVVALYALLSVVAILLDNVLAPADATMAKHVNTWFFTLPIYAATATTALSDTVTAGWQYFVTLFLFAVASGVVLWDIKTELAEKSWKAAFLMWGSFEVIYFVVVWIVLQYLGWPLFPPLSI